MADLSSFSDKELVSAIGDKNQLNNAILFIYKQFAASVSSFIVNNGGSTQDGEDIFQETVVTFIDLVNKGKFRHEASVKTFLVSIARNTWLNEINKKQRSGYREKLFENRREQEDPGISHYIDDREQKNKFREILNKLGDPCKKILTLFYYEELPMKEIVKHLPYENEQVIRNKKHKCLQQLTKLLNEKPGIIRQINEKD